MLEIRGLEVRYGDLIAVRDLDVAVAQGHVVALLGRNGAGKSSTMRAIAGSQRPYAGTIRVDGRDVTDEPAERRVARGVVLVPEGRHLFPGLSVRDNLAIGAFHRKLRGAALTGEIERATAHIPVVRERLKQRAGSLSGGEQQLVAMARALMARPRLLLADEPSLGLAPLMIERLYELLGKLRDDTLTIVVVEQYVDVALAFADHAVVLDKGQAALRGPTCQLASSPEVLSAYLADPQEMRA